MQGVARFQGGTAFLPEVFADAPAATRAALLADAGLTEVADQGLVWSGSHMPGPEKFARLTRNGAGFRRVAL